MSERLLRECIRNLLSLEGSGEGFLNEAALGGKSGLFKYPSRAQKIRDKIIANEPLALAKGPKATGDTFIIVQNKDQIVQVLDKIIAVHAKAPGGRARPGRGFAASLKDEPLYQEINDLLDASSLSLAKLHKSKDLGGEEGGAREKCEAGQIAQIQAEIEKLKSNPTDTMSFKLGSRVIDNVVGIVKVAGTPKADGALVDPGGNQIAWISFKCADEGKNMQQWGGLSQHQSTDIDNFEKDLVAYIQINGRLPKEGVYRPLTDEVLAKRAVWGMNAGSGEPGPENVNTLIATLGTIGLNEISPGVYEFTASGGGVHHDGMMPTDTFEPVLGATYRAGRGTGGLVDARVGIYPIGFRPNWTLLPIPESDKETEVVPLGDSSTPDSMGESLIRGYVRASLLTEDLSRSDKKDIERMIRKQIQSSERSDRDVKKLAEKVAADAIKDALGVSYFGTPGKINKFVLKSIHEEVNDWLGDKKTQNEIADITKAVVKKLYRELSFASPQIIDRIKV